MENIRQNKQNRLTWWSYLYRDRFWTTPRKLAFTGGVSLFFIIFVAVLMADSLHTIDEGTVGIYFVQGALREEISHPGNLG